MFACSEIRDGKLHAVGLRHGLAVEATGLKPATAVVLTGVELPVRRERGWRLGATGGRDGWWWREGRPVHHGPHCGWGWQTVNHTATPYTAADSTAPRRHLLGHHAANATHVAMTVDAAAAAAAHAAPALRVRGHLRRRDGNGVSRVARLVQDVGRVRVNVELLIGILEAQSLQVTQLA